MIKMGQNIFKAAQVRTTVANVWLNLCIVKQETYDWQFYSPISAINSAAIFCICDRSTNQ